MNDEWGNRVAGWCPMGCGKTLFVAVGGYVTCSYIRCPRPDAAADILAEIESQHVVAFDDAGFTVKHPLRERLDDALLTCDLHQFCAALPGPPVKPGRYRAYADADLGWQFREIRGVGTTPAQNLANEGESA